jgi:hypothetical protein
METRMTDLPTDYPIRDYVVNPAIIDDYDLPTDPTDPRSVRAWADTVAFDTALSAITYTGDAWHILHMATPTVETVAEDSPAATDPRLTKYAGIAVRNRGTERVTAHATRVAYAIVYNATVAAVAIARPEWTDALRELVRPRTSYPGDDIGAWPNWPVVQPRKVPT